MTVQMLHLGSVSVVKVLAVLYRHLTDKQALVKRILKKNLNAMSSSLGFTL